MAEIYVKNKRGVDMMAAEDFVETMLKSMEKKGRTMASSPNEGVRQAEIQSVLKEIQDKIKKGRTI